MKKILFALLMLTVMVGTVYSGLRWTKTAHLRAAATPVVANDALALMPDSDFVMLIDVSQFINTKLLSMLANDAKAMSEYKKFETEALQYGVDIHAVKQVAVGVSSNGQSGNAYAIISGGFDREKLLAGFAAHPDKVTVQSEDYNGKALYVVNFKGNNADVAQLGQMPIRLDQNKVGLSFLNGQTAVLGDLAGVKKTLDVQAGKQPNLLSNQQMVNYLNATNGSAMFRFAGLIPEKGKHQAADKTPEKPAKGQVLTNDELGSSKQNSNSNGDGEEGEGQNPFNKLFESVRGAYGSVDLAAGFNLDTTLLIRSEGEAKQMSDSLNGFIGIGKSMLQQDPKNAKLLEAINNVSVNGSGKDVRITMALSEQLLNELIKMINDEAKKHNK